MYRASTQVNSLDPTVWGPHGWFFLESICLSYPDSPSNEEKRHIKDFFYSLQHVLPCPACREHYSQHLNAHPLTDNVVSSRANLVPWILAIHNRVRHSNGQPPISTQAFFNYYQEQYSSQRAAEAPLSSLQQIGLFAAIGIASGLALAKILQ